MALALSTTAISQKKSGRNVILYVVLAITLSLTAWTEFHSIDESDAIVFVPQQRTSKKSVITEATENKTKAAAVIMWPGLKRQPMTNSPQDLFKVHSWFVPPPVKKIAFTPPPPPTAPKVPFSYMGKIEDSPKGSLVFLVVNNKLYSVAKGEKVDQQWRFDSEDTNTLRFTYLPLNLTQVLFKSSSNNAMQATTKLPSESNL